MERDTLLLLNHLLIALLVKFWIVAISSREVDYISSGRPFSRWFFLESTDYCNVKHLLKSGKQFIGVFLFFFLIQHCYNMRNLRTYSTDGDFYQHFFDWDSQFESLLNILNFHLLRRSWLIASVWNSIVWVQLPSVVILCLGLVGFWRWITKGSFQMCHSLHNYIGA